MSLEDNAVYVAGLARTPIGSYGGCLKDVPATELGATAIRAALARSGIAADLVDEVIMGHVLTAGAGQAPARQAAKAAGLPNKVPCTTVNKVCASGMKAVMMASQAIMTGQASVVVAGGMENMSSVPYYDAKQRWGARMGDVTLVDGMIKDGLWDPYDDQHMGCAAELCATEHKFDQAAQDAYAIQSYERAAAASNGGAFAAEICPVMVPNRKGPPTEVKVDEEFTKVNHEKLKTLRPCFVKKGVVGSVTAGNASTLNDGAAAMILVSGKKAKELGLTVVAKIRGFADAAHEPERFTTAPALAMPKALKRAGVTQDEVEFFEVNEAFSVVALANAKILGLDISKVNVHGGAVALGHPLGCSGVRIIVTLLGVLAAKGATLGAAGICNGGGGASAIVVERLASGESASKKARM